ncbi:MAG: AEC family transporter, partial [Lentisphaerota bacterium]
MIIVNILGPVILLVLLGTVLHRSGFADEVFFRGMNKLVFWVGLPCFLFISTAQPLKNLGIAAPMFFALFGSTVVMVMVAYAAGAALRLPRRSLSAFVQASFRGNLAYVGVPIVLFAIAAQGSGRDFKDSAFLVIAPLILVYNVVAVLVLVAGTSQAGTSPVRRVYTVCMHTVTNPLLIATAAGLAWAAAGWTLPLLMERTMTGVGQIASPLALVGLGATLSLVSVWKQVL